MRWVTTNNISLTVRKTKMRVAASCNSDEDPLCMVDDLSFPGKKRARESFGGVLYKDNDPTC